MLSFILVSITIFSSIVIPAEGHLNFDPPKKQMKNGFTMENVTCNWGLVLMSRSASESAACVELSTSVKLQDRGWGSILGSKFTPISTDFTPPSNTPYMLLDGETSPDSMWINSYNGYGASGIKKEQNGNWVMFEYPLASTQADETHANMILTTSKFKDFSLSLDVRTDKPIRENDPPNSWEVAWVFFRVVDTWHAYYFILKTNGIELGKSDNDDQIPEQIFLYTENTPKAQIGKWSHWDITVIDNHITIFVDNEKVVDYYDETMSELLGTEGAIGLYNEDAEVSFDNVIIIPINLGRN